MLTSARLFVNELYYAIVEYSNALTAVGSYLSYLQVFMFEG
jgi:hypothetical protein